ncbi:hypothetical protein CB1_000280001 [Camelus ferus]|nr:hypothetical protein CB1_000280001 [Camelus ferus]
MSKIKFSQTSQNKPSSVQHYLEPPISVLFINNNKLCRIQFKCHSHLGYVTLLERVKATDAGAALQNTEPAKARKLQTSDQCVYHFPRALRYPGSSQPNALVPLGKLALCNPNLYATLAAYTSDSSHFSSPPTCGNHRRKATGKTSRTCLRSLRAMLDFTVNKQGCDLSKDGREAALAGPRTCVTPRAGGQRWHDAGCRLRPGSADTLRSDAAGGPTPRPAATPSLPRVPHRAGRVYKEKEHFQKEKREGC